MSNAARPAPSRGKILLNSFLLALCAGVAYLVVTLFTGFDPLWSPVGAVIILVVLTAVFFFVNWRRASADSGSSPSR